TGRAGPRRARPGGGRRRARPADHRPVAAPPRRGHPAARAVQARRPDAAGAAGVARARRGRLERRDRGAARARRGHRQEVRVGAADQARRGEPRAGGAARPGMGVDMTATRPAVTRPIRVPEAVRRVLVEATAVLLPASAVLLGVPPFEWSVTAALVACALLPLRHLWPPLGLLGSLWALAGGLGWPPAIVALYPLGRRSRRVGPLVRWLALAVAASVSPVLLTQDLPIGRIVLTIAFAGLYAGAPAALGLLVSTRARLTESLRQLEQAREEALAASRDAARAQERARIGREIHDAVGHHATLIAVGAAAIAASP